jgi:hypothetical protein
VADQGCSLFEDTKFGEELSDMGSVATDRLGDIRRARRPEEADRCISDSGHDFGTRTLSDPACVLPERDVADVMTTILGEKTCTACSTLTVLAERIGLKAMFDSGGMLASSSAE